jgi:hypothetical protein
MTIIMIMLIVAVIILEIETDIFQYQ